MEDVKLSFTPDAYEAIAKKAIERHTGARGLRSILENMLLDIMYDLPSLEGVKEVVVNEKVVEGKVPPVLIYSKSKKKNEAV